MIYITVKSVEFAQGLRSFFMCLVFFLVEREGFPNTEQGVFGERSGQENSLPKVECSTLFSINSTLAVIAGKQAPKTEKRPYPDPSRYTWYRYGMDICVYTRTTLKITQPRVLVLN